jgi:hypothetical protein
MPANRPTSVELLNAVRGFLKIEVLPLLEGSEKYHLQVALNAVSIIEREISMAARLDEEERGRLGSLVGVSGTVSELNQLLCSQIRTRGHTYRDPRLMDHLLRTTLGKMSIDNPKYATYVRELATAGADEANLTPT